jgi:phenylacetate-coenzyme A ligase PaaK-like adenylate-forming protein
MEQLQANITYAIASVTGLTADVRLVAARTLMRSEGKAARVVDNRKL